MKRVTELTERCCRWPVGEHPPRGQMERQMFCAAPRAHGDLFCPSHMRVGCPGRTRTSAEITARNVITIKMALGRRRSGFMPVEDQAEKAVAPNSAEIAHMDTEDPAPAGFEGGAELSEISGQLPDTLRPVGPVAFSGSTSTIPTPPPVMEWMAPADLLVEGRYQRDLSDSSQRQINRIVTGWDWRKFKPPIVAWTERGFEIIDGQHTAIAAATHPEIEKIPVLVVEAPEVQDRAAAFIGHNRDHLAVTPLQLHFAAVAAGDPDAIDVQNVISRAGAKLLATQYGGQRFKAGETVAVSGVRALVAKRGVLKARQVLEVLVRAEQGPITAVQIKAADMLMNRPEYAEADLDFLPATIRDTGADVEREAKVDAKTFQIPVYEALGRIWFKKCKKLRKAA